MEKIVRSLTALIVDHITYFAGISASPSVGQLTGGHGADPRRWPRCNMGDAFVGDTVA